MLEHLTFRSDLPRVEDPKIVIVQPEPRLRSLILERIVISAGVQSAFQHCWTHLTQLWVTGTCNDDGPVLTLFALCPHLKYSVFSEVDIPLRVVAARALAHSTHLSLEVRVPRGTGFLLDALTLPSLTRLVITDSSRIGPSTWRRNELRGFLARSRCPLETLHIHSWRAPSQKDDQAAYAALIPTLKHLCLEIVEQPRKTPQG